MPPEVRKRLWMGLIMGLLAAGVLAADDYLAAWLRQPFYPFLFVGVFLLTILCCIELHRMLVALAGPPLWILLAGNLTIFLANWPAHLDQFTADPFRHILFAFMAWVIIAFLVEMALYRRGNSVTGCAMAILAFAYLGLMPAFLIQLRFLHKEHGDVALALLIAVTKGGDIGAYFTGRFLGRHPMTPVLSPKKTWEGFAGGLVTSLVAAILIHRYLVPVFTSDIEAGLFGIVVGITGVLGDLAESLIKRECGAKDASQVVPGFGGILDVVDSVVFASPVAYAWLAFRLG